MSGTLGVIVQQQTIVTGFGLDSLPASFSTIGMSNEELVAYIKSQHEAVQSAAPNRPWYNPKQIRTAGFEDVCWPPTMSALEQLIHDDSKSIADATMGKGNCPWIFSAPPCEVVCAVVGAKSVFEDTIETEDGAKRAIAVVGLEFPDMTKAGSMLLKMAVPTGGHVCLAPQITHKSQMGRIPPRHRRRSSKDCEQPKIWFEPNEKPRVKLPYSSTWIAPEGIVWPDSDLFWSKVWPAAVKAKISSVKSILAPESPTQSQGTPAERMALISELGIPSPGIFDERGKLIGADRVKSRQSEWARYVRSVKYKEEYVPRCPRFNGRTSTNAVTKFCPQDELHRCQRDNGDTVSTVLLRGTRAPCLIRAIECGGNPSRYQAAGILAVAATKRVEIESSE